MTVEKRIEAAFAARILRKYDKLRLAHRRKIDQMALDPVRLKAWFEEASVPYHEMIGLGYRATYGDGSLRGLAFSKARELAERDAGPEPSLRALLQATIDFPERE
jgi:hypothetical protein